MLHALYLAPHKIAYSPLELVIPTVTQAKVKNNHPRPTKFHRVVIVDLGVTVRVILIYTKSGAIHVHCCVPCVRTATVIIYQRRLKRRVRMSYEIGGVVPRCVYIIPEQLLYSPALWSVASLFNTLADSRTFCTHGPYVIYIIGD